MTKKRDAYLKDLIKKGNKLFEYWNPKFSKTNPIHKHGEIWLDPVNNWLYINWGNAQTVDSIQVIGKAMQKCMVDTGITTMLNDNSDVKYPWNHSHKWMSNVWLPGMVESGLSYFSWVVGEDIFAVTSVKTHPLLKGFSINTAASFMGANQLQVLDLGDQQKSKMALFDTFEQGLRWLLLCKSVEEKESTSISK